jgi:hypothetical protein
MFTANVGTPDRIIRLVLGAILIALPFVGIAGVADTWLAWAAPIVGVILAGTAFLSFCPIYRVLGLSTRPKQPR